MQHTRHINSVQWEQAMGYARQVCAAVFRDGGSPRAALAAFGLSVANPVDWPADWSAAVDRIALALCARPMSGWQRRKAA